jgi:signal transduction histidine kinase
VGAVPSSRQTTGELEQLRHDLKQYVAVGVLLTQVPHDESLDEDVRERLDRLNQVFLRMEELTRSPLRSTAEGWLVDLVDLVEECVSFAQVTHDVPLDVSSTGPIKAVCDPVLLRRAVSNVLDNATRAAGRSGRVLVRVDSIPGEAMVEVRDDGNGFGRIPSVSGHGMSIVDQALRACQGSLQIISGPGPGTIVRMHIPVEREPVS